MNLALFNEAAPRTHVLPNGLTLVLERLPHLYSASAGVWIKTGSANESPQEAGLAHFLEHLFFKGTETRNAHDLMEAIESRGGHFNAFTSREYTCLYVRMLEQHLATGIEILGDVIRSSTFCDLVKERNVIIEEIASIEDVPEEHAHDLAAMYHWPDHPLGQPISGSQESVRGLELEHVQRYFKSWYRPSNMVVTVAGNFDEDAVLAQLRAEFGGLENAPIPARPAGPAFRAAVDIYPKEIAQSHLCIAFPGTTVHDEQRFVHEVLSNTLGGGSTSRLFERIREDEGLAYSIYTHQGVYTEAGFLGIYAAIAPQNLQQTLDITYEELRRLCEEPVPEAELASNREQIKGNILMALESTNARMSRLGKSQLYYGRVLTAQEVIDAIDGVTAADVQQLARKMFTRETTAILAYGPTGGADVHEVQL